MTVLSSKKGHSYLSFQARPSVVSKFRRATCGMCRTEEVVCSSIHFIFFLSRSSLWCRTPISLEYHISLATVSILRYMSVDWDWFKRKLCLSDRRMDGLMTPLWPPSYYIPPTKSSLSLFQKKNNKLQLTGIEMNKDLSSNLHKWCVWMIFFCLRSGINSNRPTIISIGRFRVPVLTLFFCCLHHDIGRRLQFDAPRGIVHL